MIFNIPPRSVIHNLEEVDFDNYVYTGVYSVDYEDVTINNIPIKICPTTLIPINLTSIWAEGKGVDVFCVGNKKDFYNEVVEVSEDEEPEE
jgi:hypothetical protein